jgi:UDP-2,4-diacetamido-2,4,6-trideoxy-beta-L-altropyranose hydrolase
MIINNFIVRADASIEIGTGHIMRCLTLATFLRKHGHKITFICRELPGNLCDYIEENNFPVWRLSNNLKDSDDIWRSEADQIIGIINQHKSKIDWLIIDHYGLDIKWERSLRPYVHKIMVIDDLANRLHDCDLLLDQNPYENHATRYRELVNVSCLTLLGLDYLMLRSEFTSQSKASTRQISTAKNILITMGGSDVKNITCWLIEALEHIKIPLSIRIVVGSGCPHFEKIKISATTETLHQINIKRSVTNISEWMNWADLAICAGGFTSYELAFMGVPTLVVSASSTQLEAAITLHKLGITKFIGEFGSISRDDIVAELINMILNHGQRAELSHKGKTEIDGCGVNRVVKHLLKDMA